MRTRSFGQADKSWLDLAIEYVRTKSVIPYIPDGATMLDLGCGYDSRLLMSLLPKLNKGIGIDLSVNSNLVRNKLKLLNGRVDEKLPIKSNTVDIVTALAIIEHVDDPSMMLRESRRVLKRGGKLVITTPSLYGKIPLEVMATLGLISKVEIDDHKRYYLPHTLKDALVDARFKPQLIQVKTFGLGKLNILAIASK